MKRTTLGLRTGVAAIALLAAIAAVPTTSAGPELWASIKTTASCSLSGSDLTVTVGWVRIKEGTPDPIISRETVTLEQRVDNQWVAAGTLFDGEFGGNPHDHTFAVTILEGATSLRTTVSDTRSTTGPAP